MDCKLIIETKNKIKKPDKAFLEERDRVGDEGKNGLERNTRNLLGMLFSRS